MSSGAAKEIQMLYDVLEMIAGDFSAICCKLGVKTSTELMLKRYFQQYEGPTALEQVLINEGCLTQEEVCRNTLFEQVNRQVNQIINTRRIQDE